ncbi:unnamed protein product (macronuclear) [Paramecium tetraurelia]|uniref:Uncharacterized protein n=1 Tax=Paramecium tetraurelia TaxID=5888 RepID=A0CIZ4_PARTE|nr:uncharacterized protein GSPATT00007896001 [Paramecium tetraurelia]CAK70761.1 unnamed protein product [Paramecium tetraurelia]|eukprot:XP_001438158.1 hypothetical protein (macronuclear) [Paramecium tetraurelia strain d4-2]
MYRSSYYESDQKDIIIAQLKADIYEAQKQQEELEQLEQEMGKWEIKIKMANEEKLLLEHEHKQKHEQCIGQIQMMTQEINQLSKILKERHLDQERQILQQKELEEINDQRQLEIQQARKQLNKLSDSVIQETSIIENLQHKLEQFEQESYNAEVKNKDLNRKINEIQQKNRKIEQDCQILQDQLIQLQQSDQEQEINKYQQQLAYTNEHIKKIEQEFQQQKQNNKSTEQQINRMNQELQQNEVDLSKQRKYLIMEQQKKDDLNKKKAQLQKTQLHRQEQYSQADQEFNKTKMDNQTIINDNNCYKNKLKQLQTHIDNLMKVNQELVSELEYYCGDDQKIKQILNRAARVKELQLRVVQGNRLLKK